MTYSLTVEPVKRSNWRFSAPILNYLCFVAFALFTTNMFEHLLPFIAALAAGLAMVQIVGLAVTTIQQRYRIGQCRNSESTQAVGELQYISSASSKNGVQGSSPNIKRELILAESHFESNDVRTFRFTDPTGDLLPSFQPGQHLLLTARPNADTSLSRCYSLSSGPRSDYWQISVKRKLDNDRPRLDETANVRSMSCWLHSQLQDGQVITVSHPRGNFVLDESSLASASQVNDSPTPILLMAAGVGVTPIVSMLERIVELRSVNPILVLYQVRDLQHAAFHERLLEINRLPNVELKIFCSQLDANKEYPSPFYGGKINSQTFEQSTQFAVGDAYLCGPSSWMSLQTTRLLQFGFSDSRIRTESFGSSEQKVSQFDASESENNNEPFCNVNFAKSSTEISVSDRSATVLELATAAEVEITSSCRSGNCGSCVVRLLSGQVKNSVEPSCGLAEDEIAACVAKPDGDISIHA